MNLLEAKILRVDLTLEEISFEPTKPYYTRFLGGRGISEYILIQRMSHRWFAVIVKGKCDHLCYLKIHDGRIAVQDARHLKGLTVSETERKLREELGNDIKILSIGPAGEHLVRGACIIVDSARAAGRCGLGAIMGSKNLKAVVVRGTGKIEVANKKALKETVDRFVKNLLAHPFNKDRLKYGVYCGEPWQEESPYRNFQGGVPDREKTRRVSRDAFLKYRQGQKTCKACPIQCWGVYEFDKAGVALMLYFYTVGIGNKTFFGLYAGHTLIALPYVFLAITSVLYNFDYSLEEVSRSLGAGRFTTFFKITLPLIKGGIISGCIFAFITSFDQFPLSLMLTGPGYSTLPVQLFDYLRFEFDPTAAAVSTINIALATIVVVITERFVGLESLYWSGGD